MLNDSLGRQKIKLNLNIYFNTKVAKTNACFYQADKLC